MKYISDNEIVCCSFEDAVKITEVLMRNNYVCMLSQEEDLIIINFEWDEHCNRNGMIFRNREDWEWEEDKECEKCYEDKVGDCCND